MRKILWICLASVFLIGSSCQSGGNATSIKISEFWGPTLTLIEGSTGGTIEDIAWDAGDPQKAPRSNKRDIKTDQLVRLKTVLLDEKSLDWTRAKRVPFFPTQVLVLSGSTGSCTLYFMPSNSILGYFDQAGQSHVEDYDAVEQFINELIK